MANDTLTPPPAPSPSPARHWAWQHGDTFALIAIVLVCLVAAIPRWLETHWMVGFDGFNDFLPDWAYLGQRLRDFEVPGWNPYYSSGTPFAGDPGTGWMYLPIMLAFFLFSNVLVAWKFLIFLMAALAGGGAYLFARRIGLGILPAFYAGLTFALGPLLFGMTTDRIAVSTTYLPVIFGLLAAEMALHSRRPAAFLGWTALGGIALSQNLAAWPAQGMIYTLMYIAGWLAWRWLFAPLPDASGRTHTLKRAIAFGIGSGITALAFGAAALWPLIEVTDQSTIPGGDYSQAYGGEPVTPTSPFLNLLDVILRDSPSFRITTAAGAMVLLATIAVLLFRRRYGMPYFALTAFIFIDISADESITRWVFYLVPFIEHAHAHRPTAAVAFAFPALNLLAAIGIQMLLDERRVRRTALAIAGAVVLNGAAFAWFAIQRDVDLGRWPLAMMIVATVIALGLVWQRQRHDGLIPRNLAVAAPIAFLCCAIVYPTIVDSTRIATGEWVNPGMDFRFDGDYSTTSVDYVIDRSASPDVPGSAAEFLVQRSDIQQPFRYAVYYSPINSNGYHVPFIYRRVDPFIVNTTIVGPQSALLEVGQTSSYNPLHMRDYVDYMTAMQGRPQDYHFADIFEPALDQSQLFAMLNVRYVVVPANISTAPPIASYGTEVYRDPMTIVYENPLAFSRAWVVHDVQPLDDAASDLDTLNTYAIKGDQVAFVSGDLPAVAPLPDGAAADSVVVTRNDPEEIRLTVSTAADGLLVLSEVYTDGWVAHVDGQETDVLQTNLALRGVAVPAGDHDIVLTYEPRWLTWSLPVTGVAAIGILGIWAWAAVDARRHRRSPDIAA